MTTLQIENADVADERTLNDKLNDLEELLRPLGRVLVSYSGGVDSALLVVAAHRVLGDRAIALTADSESYAKGELEAAAAILEQFGIRHEVVRTRELDNPNYASNPVDRCYYCKSELFTHMDRMARELGADAILYGQNADDVGDFRPGATAAREYGVLAPLAQVGMDKQDVRELARRWGIPVWNRPAGACLSSRFPYGTPVTAEGLRRVDRAEKVVCAAGFQQLRVRHHRELARIELPVADVVRVLGEAQLQRHLHSELIELGYRRVTLDLRGFRSGSLNEPFGSDDSDRDPLQSLHEVLCSQHVSAELDEEEQVVCLLTDAPELLADPVRRQSIIDTATALAIPYFALDLSGLER
ncbi:MAG: ATP-dependent sacrificial sulfur transferase LarE [Candidatus Latescibacterota bacterium]|nr:ATP-dependent sacrificial sulfur transferase LarE [Candidatus Latescibacterota bacterium]